MRADFAALGVEIEDDGQDESDGETVFWVWDISWPAFLAFLDMETQWRCVGLGMTGVLIKTGLDYATLDVVLRRRELGPDAFDDIRAMERAALATFDEMRD